MTDFDFLTVEQVAKKLGITVRAVNYAIERGEFPGARKLDPSKENSSWLIPQADLQAYKKRKGTAPLKQPSK